MSSCPAFTTRTEEKRVQATFANIKFTTAHQIGQDALHTATYINDRGDKMFVKFDASRPCKFNTNETRYYIVVQGRVQSLFLQNIFRFYKPKLHTFGY